MRTLRSYMIAAALLLSHIVAAQLPVNNVDELYARFKKSKEDTARVNLLFNLSVYYFFKTSTDKKYFDSAFFYEHATEQLSEKLNYQKGLGDSYRLLAKIFRVQNDLSKSKQFSNKAIAIYKANNLYLDLGEAYFDVTAYYSINNTDELTERIRIVEQLALPAFQKSGSKLKEADILKELGDLLQLEGNYIKALSVLHRSLELYQNVHYPKLQGIYDLLGAVYAITGNNELALKYGLLAVKSAALVKDTTIQLATIYNRIGSTYSAMKKYNAAYDYFQKALVVAKKYNNTETIDLLLSKISRTLIALNKPREALIILKQAQQKYPSDDVYSQLYITASFLITYNALKRYDEAEKYCNQLLAISKKLERYEPDQSEAQYPVTEFYLATHQYELARKHLAETDTFYKKIESPLELYKNHLLWFRLDSIQGNYLSAISHYQQYKALSDSLLNETTNKHIDQLQIEFETEKKNQDIKLLENESKSQRDKLIQANATRNWVFGVAALLLIITALLISNTRVKQRSNQKLKVQQKEIEKKNIALEHLVEEKEWLVKEIHHRVKNNFHTVAGLLATQSEFLKTAEAITAMDESRNRIHAMALIHQKLYQSDNLSAINMPAYIHELTDYLLDCFNSRKYLQLNLQIEPMELNLSYCVPLGLILNEAITNAMKYAFPNNRRGIINIILKRTVRNNMLLIVKDDGVGLPGNFNSKNAASMGMKLMRGLSEDIDGRLIITSNQGTTIQLEFLYEA